MTAKEFMSRDLREGDKVAVTFGKDGSTRTVRLFFRGFRPQNDRSHARSADELKPLFSPPSARGGINKKYYKACDTAFGNILQIDKIQ